MNPRMLKLLLSCFFTIILFQLQAQNRAAYFDAFPEYFTCGDIDIAGTQLTVEGMLKVNGTGSYTSLFPHTIVSKHQGTIDANYLLRGDHGEIRTTNGFFATPSNPTAFIKDSFYHVAMTYNGSFLRYYVNGCLYSQVAVTGNMVNNNYLTTLGQWAFSPTTVNAEQVFGYIDEVRIWNVTRTQQEIAANMHNLLNPTIQPGLVAYYKFEGNSSNVQGNSAFNAIPSAGATIEIQDFSSVKSFNASYNIQPLTCNVPGSITVLPSGGKSPFQYSINGSPYQSSNVFNNLGAGSFTVTVRTDAAVAGGECTKDTTIVLSSTCNTDVSPGFTIPDTVCVNTPVTINNTSTGASSYYWNFCVADITTAPTGLNFGNIGGNFTAPVYIDYVQEGGNYYGFLTNNLPGKLLRLDFGNSLLNTPTVTNLGTVGGAIMNHTEGVQVVKNEGKWYVLIVGGDPAGGSVSAITKIELGTNIANNTPTGTNWGNIGNLAYPHDLYVFNDNGIWYGLTVNTTNNTITRFNFTSSFNNVPTAVNLGNIGALTGPTGVYAMKENGNWYAFVTNANSNSLSRLNFGNSLLNVPTGVNLGNIGGSFSTPWDIHITNFCGKSVGYLINATGNNLVKLDFNGSIVSTPVASSFGNIGNLNFPHAISKIFREGSDLYSFIPNVNNNTLTRIKFTGCTNSSVPNSTLQNPAPVIYNQPGTYNINLSVDDGLSTQAAICKQVVVLPPPTVNIFNADTSIYKGDVVQVNHTIQTGTYSWTPATGLNCTNCTFPIASPVVSTTYYLTVTTNCGLIKDSVRINVVDRINTTCPGFQVALGTLSLERGYDIVPSLNNEFIIVGHTMSGGNPDILVAKLNLDGTILWSKRFGGGSSELVRKATATADGGVLITGQTRSYGNANGDILALKITNAGTIAWARRFGVGSAAGDLGMDIIETTDGGYAISGILDVGGLVANGLVIKLNLSANVVWSRNFDHLDGDDGVGIVQRGDTLVTTTDLQNSFGNYSVAVTKLRMSNGDILFTKRLTPASRGLFNPYIYKNPSQPGYILSGHTIDGTSYANMKHTVLVLDNNLDIVSTKLVNTNPVTTDFFTGFIPLPDGSFIGAASPFASPDGFIYRVAADGSIVYTKKFNDVNDRRIYRLASTGTEILAIGGTMVNGQEDLFLANFNVDGSLGPNCNIETTPITIQQPPYTATTYTWPSSNLVNFTNTIISPGENTISLTKTNLCPLTPLDFSFQQNLCSPKTVQFSTTLSAGLIYNWYFGDGQTNNSSQTPTITYTDYGTYSVKLKVQYPGGCSDSLVKTINIQNSFDNTIVFNNDTTICLGDSVLIQASNQLINYCWQSTSGPVPNTINAFVHPDTTTTYTITSQVTGNNLVVNGNFSSGNTGFTSQYTASSSGLAAGVYNVGSSISAWHPSMAPCSDHTTGSGNMMMVNGANVPNVNVWTQTIAVQPNTNYVFYTWLQHITSVNPAQLQFSINNVPLGNIFTANNQSCIWERFYSGWNSGNSTTATISIMNMNQQFSGNDFAIDDIFFGPVVTRTDSFKVNVSVPPLFDPLADTSICIGNSVILMANAPGSISFAWTPASSLSNPAIANPLATPADTTEYIVTAFNATGCSNQDTIIVNVAPAPLHTPTQNLLVCSNTQVKIGSPVQGASYLWSTGAATDSVLVSLPGVYWVQSTLNGCSVRDSFLVSGIAAGYVDFESEPNLCSSYGVQFIASMSNTSSFEWNFGDGQTNTTSTAPLHNYASSGVYTVKLFVNYSGGCQDSLIKTITVSNVFDNSILINSDTTICLGDSVLIRTVDGLVNYCWQSSNGPVPASLYTYVHPTSATVYNLTSQKTGVNLVANGNFSAGISGFTSDYTPSSSGIAAGVFTVGSSISSWHPSMANCSDHTSGSGNMMMVNGANVANVKVWTQTINVQPNTNYIFYSWLQNISNINPAQLQFSINNVPLGSIFNANNQSCVWERFYSGWNSGASTTATISIVNMSQQFSGNDFAIDDIFFGEVTTLRDSFTVNIKGYCDSISITGAEKICSPDEVVSYTIHKPVNCTQLYSLIVDPAYAQVISQTETSLQVKYLQNGNTKVRVSYANDCKTVVDSMEVTVKFSPTGINFGPDITLCSDTAFILNAGAGFEFYTWQDGSSAQIMAVSSPGIYHVLAQNLCGSQFRDTLEYHSVGAVPFGVVTSAALICAGDSISLQAMGGTSYSWSPAANFENPAASITKAVVHTTQNYSVTIVDAICSRDTVILVPVTAREKALVTISKSNNVNCSNDSAILKASGGVDYVWSPANSITRNTGAQITVKPGATTTYTVKVTDDLGCTGIDSVTVNFSKEGEQKLYMPTGFTPDGDGLNDLYRPAFIGPAVKYDFRVYNRWGALVFRSTTPGVGWDGTFRSKPQPKDVFVYYITAEGGCSGRFEQKGTFVLIR